MRKYLFPFLILTAVSCQTGPRTSLPPTQAGSISSAGHPLSIMQGVTTDTWTQITLHRLRAKNYEVTFTTKDGSTIPEIMIRRTQKDYQASEWMIDGFVIHDINPKSTYRMIVKENGQVVDQRTFSTLERKEKIKFAVVSCLNDAFKEEQKKIWGELAAKKPELIIAAGDNSYADLDQGKMVPEASSLLLWNRYSETRQSLELYHLETLIPVLATWDDHDYGVNDGDRRYKTRDESQAIFYAFFQQDMHDPQFNRGPGVASIYRHGQHHFVLLDNRSFRSVNQMSPICKDKQDNRFCRPYHDKRGPDPLAKKSSETHFGSEQEQWLWQQLKKIQGPVFLISGNQWFGAYHPFESYEGNHPKSFKKFMADLAKTGARAVFIGGDRHNFELSRIEKSLLGYETYELISSPLHSNVYPSNWGDFPNPRQIAGAAQVFNYSIVDSVVTGEALKFKVETYKLGGEKISDQDLSVPLQ